MQVLSLWERQSSDVAVWGAAWKEVTEPSVHMQQLCWSTLPYTVPFAYRARPKNQKRELIFGDDIEGTVAFIWLSIDFLCLQRLGHKYSHFQWKSRMVIADLKWSCMKRLELWLQIIQRDTPFGGKKLKLTKRYCCVFLAAPWRNTGDKDEGEQAGIQET